VEASSTYLSLAWTQSQGYKVRRCRDSLDEISQKAPTLQMSSFDKGGIGVYSKATEDNYTNEFEPFRCEIGWVVCRDRQVEAQLPEKDWVMPL